MLTNREIAREVEARSDRKSWQKIFIKKMIFLSIFIALCILSTGVIAENNSDTVYYVLENSPYASLVFAGSYAGGYVVVGIGALVLGIVITMFCLYATEKKQRTINLRKGDDENEK